MASPEPVGLPADTPIVVGGRRVRVCGECAREADILEQAGMQRPELLPVRTYIRFGITYYGALCVKHDDREFCLTFQQARMKTDRQDQIAIDSNHEAAIAQRGRPCLCIEALKLLEQWDEQHRRYNLHPCVGQCGRMLRRGVGRCFECRKALGSTASGTVVTLPRRADEERKI